MPKISNPGAGGASSTGAGGGRPGGGIEGLFGGQLGGVKLKKTVTVEKTMFAKGEGEVSKKKMHRCKEGKRSLSKLLDFPGDVGMCLFIFYI